jgi:pyroglutamyl-peptidase
MDNARKTPGNAAREAVLLVTGFGPFENFVENPSGDVAELVDRREIAGVRVVGRRFPVHWREMWEAIHAVVREHRPSGLLCLGVASDPFFRLEVLAKNVALPRIDVRGEHPRLFDLGRIVPDAPPAYWTELPVDWLTERLRARRDELVARGTNGPVVGAERWPDAGAFLCNYVFFHAMHFLPEVPYRGFVHVPRYPTGDGSAAIPRHEVTAAGVFLVEELARWLGRKLSANAE